MVSGSLAGAAPAPALEPAILPLAGKLPGMLALATAALELPEANVGTGDPRRWPEPWKACAAEDELANFEGVYASLRRFTTRNSTGCPGRTLSIWGGARLRIGRDFVSVDARYKWMHTTYPELISASICSLTGSSYLIRGPSSTLNPSDQNVKLRTTGSASASASDTT